MLTGDREFLHRRPAAHCYHIIQVGIAAINDQLAFPGHRRRDRDRLDALVETGETMRQNGLCEVETIAEVSSRLVVNPASLKLRGDEISRLVDRLERVAVVP